MNVDRFCRRLIYCSHIHIRVETEVAWCLEHIKNIDTTVDTLQELQGGKGVEINPYEAIGLL